MMFFTHDNSHFSWMRYEKDMIYNRVHVTYLCKTFSYLWLIKLHSSAPILIALKECDYLNTFILYLNYGKIINNPHQTQYPWQLIYKAEL